jgi:hypothetical protein
MDKKYEMMKTSRNTNKAENLDLKKNDLEFLQARRLIKEQRITNSYIMT